MASARRNQPAARPAARHAPAPAANRSSALARSVDALVDEDEDDGVSVVKVEPDVLAAVTKSEVEMQLAAAHRYPRSIQRFLDDSTTLATLNKQTAQSCMFSLPRSEWNPQTRQREQKIITGASVRLAEICASEWRNMHTGARIIDVGAREVTAQAGAWDLEKNHRLSIEVKRNIVTNKGERFGDDMIRTTSMAAISIAWRNAIFRVIPRALVDQIYYAAVDFATGAADNTFEVERDKVLGWFITKNKVPADRVFLRLGVADAKSMTPEHLAVLIGFGSSIKAKETTFDECFPPPAPVQAVPAQSKGAALDAMVDAAKQQAAASTGPTAKVGGSTTDITAEMVHRELAAADPPMWEPTERIEVIRAWSPAEQRIAYDWAVANNDPSIEDGQLPPRPEYTMLQGGG
jgi:hypothetical protein